MNSSPYCWIASYVFRPIINAPYSRQRLRKFGHRLSGIKSSLPSFRAIKPSDDITLYKVSIILLNSQIAVGIDKLRDEKKSPDKRKNDHRQRNNKRPKKIPPHLPNHLCIFLE